MYDYSEIIEIPFNLPGKVFRSCMPFSSFDHKNSVYDGYKRLKVSAVAVLSSPEECLRHTGKDLIGFYKQEGLEVIQIGVQDFGIPDLEEFTPFLNRVIQRAHDKKNIAIHCFAGIGRTGVLLSCMAKQLFDLSGENSIKWVRQYIHGAVQTREQEIFVERA